MSFHDRAKVALASLLLALGCALAVRADGGKAPAESNVPEAYKLAPGDQVALSVVPQKGYDCKGTVLPDGSLRLTSVGKMVATGSLWMSWRRTSARSSPRISRIPRSR